MHFDGTYYAIFFLLDGTWIVHVLNDGARDGSHDMVSPFLEGVLNNFDVSRQLTERREACLLRLLPRQRVRGGSQHKEKLLLTSGARATVHLVLDCQKYYFSTIILVRLPEEEKSQVQGHLLT